MSLSEGSKVAIAVAVIGLIGTLGAALILRSGNTPSSESGGSAASGDDGRPAPPDKPPFEPSQLRYSVSKDGIRLTWVDNSTREEGFKVYHRQFRHTASRGSRPEYRLAKVLPRGKTSYFHPIEPGLFSGYQHEFEVCSYNRDGESQRVFTAVALK